MKLKTSCPHCHVSLSLKSELIGARVKCPQCQKSFIAESVHTPSSPHSLESAIEAHSSGNGHSIDNSSPATSQSGKRKPSHGSLAGTLGRFQLQGILGEGGYGRVYRAYDPQLDRLLALKVPTFATNDQTKAKRFQAEAKAAASLRHPNIVPTFESGQIGNQFFIASQFIEGKPLSEIIKLRSVEVRQAAQWVSQIAQALAYAHDMGIVHRDVKPHNVMLDDRNNPQLMDFGLAKRVNEDSGMTTDGALMGTPAYMAPEQARGEMTNVGPHSDQYAVGAILYELLTGKRAFEGSPHSVISQILSNEPKPPRSLNPQIPRDLEAITQKAMSKEISRRYASCHELAADLDRWLAGEATIARPITSTERLSRWAKRNRWIAGALGTTMLAIILVGVIGLWAAGYQAYASRQLRLTAEASDKQRKIAEDNTKLAQDALKTANDEKARADQQRKIAEERQISEAAQRKLAEERLAESRKNAYVAGIRLAETCFKSFDYVRMKSTLDSLRPLQGEKDLRGWEWNFLWNVAHQEAASISAPDVPSPLSQLAFSPDGESIVSTGGVPIIWDIRTGTSRIRIDKEKSSISARYSVDGRSLFIGNGDGEINCWDPATGALKFSIPAHISDSGMKSSSGNGKPYAPVDVIATSNDGKRVASISRYDRNGKVWEAATGKLVSTLPTTYTYVKQIALSPDGKLAATLSILAGQVHLWDVNNGRILSEINAKETSNVCFSPDGTHLATCMINGGVAIWDTRNGNKTREISKEYGINQIQYSADGKRLLGRDSNTIRVWDSDQGTLLSRFNVHSQWISADISKDGRWVVSGEVDKTIRIWDAQGETNQLELHERRILPQRDRLSARCFTGMISADGKYLFAGLEDRIAASWDLESGELCEEYRAPARKPTEYPVHFCSFSPEKRLIIGSVSEGTYHPQIPVLCTSVRDSIMIWNCDSGEIVATISKPIEPLRSNFTRPDRLLLIGSDPASHRLATFFGAEVEVWDLTTGSRTHNVNVHFGRKTKEVTRWIWTAAFPKIGKSLITGGEDGNIFAWDLNSGIAQRGFRVTEAGTISSQVIPVSNLSVDASSSRILATAGGTTLFVLDANTGARLITLQSVDGQFTSASFSPNGQRIIACDQHVLRVYDSLSGQELLSIDLPHFNQNCSASFDPSGNLILVTPAKSGESHIFDGSPESDWKTRTAERVARSTVAYFRRKTRTNDELLTAIRNDKTISTDAQALAVKFASKPQPKIVNLKF